ncbi:MAG: hypothetical protein AAGF11_55300 [Myxococcota bacterium]
MRMVVPSTVSLGSVIDGETDFGWAVVVVVELAVVSSSSIGSVQPTDHQQTQAQTSP